VFVTECTMIEPTPLIRETEVVSQFISSSLRNARGCGIKRSPTCLCRFNYGFGTASADLPPARNRES
jgi:hypothetical protein